LQYQKTFVESFRVSFQPPWSADMKKIFVYTMFLILAVSAGLNLIQFYNNYRISYISEIRKEAGRINSDGFSEVMGAYLQNVRDNTVDNARQQGKLEGIVSLVHKIPPQESEISSIWHAGYQRGLEQTDFVGEMNYEKGYTAGITKGREEYLKAVNNILNSGNDFKSSLQEFIKNSTKDQPEEKTNKESPPVKPMTGK
jgi:hypothetical protein